MRCHFCECDPCFLDCLERRRAAPPPVREASKTGTGYDAHRSERKALLARARSMLQRGTNPQAVAEATGLRRDYVSVIAYRLRHGLTGGRSRRVE